MSFPLHTQGLLGVIFHVHYQSVNFAPFLLAHSSVLYLTLLQVIGFTYIAGKPQNLLTQVLRRHFFSDLRLTVCGLCHDPEASVTIMCLNFLFCTCIWEAQNTLFLLI